MCNRAAPIKRTAVERMVNVQIVFLFIILLALSVGSSIGSFIRTVSSHPKNLSLIHTISSQPLRRTFRLIFLIPHFGNLKTVRKYVGKDDNTELTSFNLPARFRSFPFQLANVPPTLSIKGWMSTLPIALMCSGKPKYLHGKLFIGQLKASIICSS